MAHRQLDARSRKALAAAHLASEGANQEQIRRHLGLAHQPEVSRLLSLARERKWLSWRIDWAATGLSPGDVDAIKGMGFRLKDELHERLSALGRDRAGIPLKSLSIVHGGGDLGEPATYETYGAAAAGYLRPLIARAGTIAVAWGRTISSVVNSLAKERAYPEKLFVPVSGEPLNYNGSGLSPSVLTEQLADIFGSRERLSLRGVPARIPKDLARQEAAIRRFVGQCRDYRRIFGGTRPLIEHVDMIVSGIGDTTTSRNDPWLLEIQEMEGLKNLRAMSAGNIGGVWWLPQERSDRKRISELNRRGLGIQQAHFEACARRGHANQGAGVVVLAVEPEKANIIRLSMGMVNHLIISEPLARKFQELIEAGP